VIKVKKLKLISLGIMLIAFALVIGPVLAATIRVEPHGSYFGLPIMLSSPATFNVTVVGSADNPTTDPHIFLVMTETSYNSLTGNVVVNWTDGSPTMVTMTPWTQETVNSAKVPPGADSGTGYTVALLRDHLNTTEPIYWAFEPFLGGMNISEIPIDFTVTLPATDPRMAVYVLGKTGDSELFNNRSPPTQPGFVVPELGTILLAASSFGAFALFALRRKKQ
jgi:hypothetical protein